LDVTKYIDASILFSVPQYYAFFPNSYFKDRDDLSRRIVHVSHLTDDGKVDGGMGNGPTFAVAVTKTKSRTKMTISLHRSGYFHVKPTAANDAILMLAQFPLNTPRASDGD